MSIGDALLIEQFAANGRHDPPSASYGPPELPHVVESLADGRATVKATTDVGRDSAGIALRLTRLA